MIMDKFNEFASEAALNTGGAGSYLVGNVIDLMPDGVISGGIDLGTGEDLYLVMQMDTTATSGGSNTTAFHLVSDAQAAIATDGSATYHYSSPAIPVATLVAGYRICAIRLPSGTYERYLGILQTTAVAALTAGKINAFLTKDISAWKAYPNAID